MFSSQFADVGALSDDEGVPLVTPVRARRSTKRASSSGKCSPKTSTKSLFQCKVSKTQRGSRSSSSHGNVLGRTDLVSRARAIVQGKCRCARKRSSTKNCFQPFRDPRTFNLLCEHLRKLSRLDKMEVDKEAGNELLNECVGFKLHV